MKRLSAACLLSLVLATPAWADFVFAPGTFSITSGTGTQEVTNAACAQPKVVLAWWTRATADATFTAGQGFGFGVAVDAVSDQQGVITYLNVDNVGTTDSNAAKSAVRFIQNQNSTTGGVGMIATISSFNSDGFTINKTSNDDANNNIIHYVCLGGSDIESAFFGEFTGPATAIEQAYTGVGFQGNLGMFLAIQSATLGTTNGSDYEIGIGFAKSASEEAAIGIYGNDGSTSANQAESRITSSASFFMPSGGGLNTVGLADFVSWDADGFTLNHTNAAVASPVFFALILKGTFQSHIGVQARATSQTTQDVTSPGFQPKGVMLFGGFATALDTDTVQGHLSIGAGEADGTVAENGNWNSDAASIDTDVNMYSSSTKIYTQATNPSTVAAQADLNAWLSNGYQLDWTTADANARLFMHVALAGAASSRRPSMPIIFGWLDPLLEWFSPKEAVACC